VAIKFGEWRILKFGDLHDEIESFDVIMRTTYSYSHLSLVAAGSQKMETHKVTAVSVVIMYSEVSLFGTPHIDRVAVLSSRKSVQCHL